MIVQSNIAHTKPTVMPFIAVTATTHEALLKAGCPVTITLTGTGALMIAMSEAELGRLIEQCKAVKKTFK